MRTIAGCHECHDMSPAYGWKWKWSNGVGKSEGLHVRTIAHDCYDDDDYLEGGHDRVHDFDDDDEVCWFGRKSAG